MNHLVRRNCYEGEEASEDKDGEEFKHYSTIARAFLREIWNLTRFETWGIWPYPPGDANNFAVESRVLYEYNTIASAGLK